MDVGSVVKYNGEDVIILRVDAPLGFRQFTIMNLSNGSTKTVARHQLDIDEEQSENILNWIDQPLIPDVQPEQAERFPSVDNEEDIDALAASRLSKNTVRQTEWAVKVLKGKYYSHTRVFVIVYKRSSLLKAAFMTSHAWPYKGAHYNIIIYLVSGMAKFVYIYYN